MSRFEQDFHKKLLESPTPEGHRNIPALYKEKTIWRLEGLRKYLAYSMFKVQSTIVFSSLILGLLLILWSGVFNKNNFYLIIACIVAFGPLLFIAIWFAGNAIWIKARSRKIVRKREDIELEKFVSYSPLLQKHNRYHIKAIRQTLGHIYSVNSKIIYLSDTPESLRSLGCITEPYGFELILGVGKRLGIFLTEPEVDRIADRIYNNAHNVEELTAILCEEMSVAEDSQKPECFEVQDVKENTTTNEYSVWLFLAGMVALVSGLSQAAETLKKGRAISTFSSIVSILIVMVISFLGVFIIGILITKLMVFIIERVFSRKLNRLAKKVKDLKIPVDIDLEELRDLALPVHRYISHLVIELYHKQDYEKLLKKYEPLPLIDGFDPDEIPWFAEVANRLKKMAKMEQIPFVEPRNGIIPLLIQGKPANLNVEFCDGLKDGYVKLNLEK